MVKDDAHSSRQWHPAFLQAMKMELFDYWDSLEFSYEYQLAAAPLRVDLLVVKKTRDVAIDKNIARIFRSDNLLEYKSPEDYLSVEDFWKVCAYANQYAAITPGVDLADLTLTFIGRGHPRKLLRYLTKVRGYTAEETWPGIYLVTGDYIPIQIVESQNLSRDENSWLESLKNGLKIDEAGAILKNSQGKEAFLDAYLDILLRKNPRVFLEVHNMAKRKRETFEEVFTEAGIIPEWMERGRARGIEQGIERGIEQGIVQGLEQGREKTARNLLRMGMPLEDIARASELPVEKIRALAVAS